MSTGLHSLTDGARSFQSLQTHSLFGAGPVAGGYAGAAGLLGGGGGGLMGEHGSIHMPMLGGLSGLGGSRPGASLLPPLPQSVPGIASLLAPISSQQQQQHLLQQVCTACVACLYA